MVVVSGATASATQATSSGYLAEGKNFQSLGLSPELSTALANCGFATPTTVQVMISIIRQSMQRHNPKP